MGKCEFVGCMCRDNIYVCTDDRIYCSQHWVTRRDELLEFINHGRQRRNKYVQQYGNMAYTKGFDDEIDFFKAELNKCLKAKQYASIDAYEAEKQEKEKQAAEVKRLQVIDTANKLLAMAKNQSRFENGNAEQARKLISEADLLVGNEKHQEAKNLLEKNYSWTTKKGKSFYALLPHFDSGLEAALKEEAKEEAEAESQRLQLISKTNELLAVAKRQNLLKKENAEQARKLISEAESLSGSGKHQEVISLLEKRYDWKTEKGKSFSAPLSAFDSCLETALKEEAAVEARAKEVKTKGVIATIKNIFGIILGAVIGGIFGFMIVFACKIGGGIRDTIIYTGFIIGIVIGGIIAFFAQAADISAKTICGIIISAIIGGITGAIMGGGTTDTIGPGFIIGIVVGGIIAFITQEETGAGDGAKKGALFGVIGFFIGAIILTCIGGSRSAGTAFIVGIFLGPIGGVIIGALNGSAFSNYG